MLGAACATCRTSHVTPTPPDPPLRPRPRRPGPQPDLHRRHLPGRRHRGPMTRPHLHGCSGALQPWFGQQGGNGRFVHGWGTGLDRVSLTRHSQRADFIQVNLRSGHGETEGTLPHKGRGGMPSVGSVASSGRGVCVGSPTRGPCSGRGVLPGRTWMRRKNTPPVDPPSWIQVRDLRPVQPRGDGAERRRVAERPKPQPSRTTARADSGRAGPGRIVNRSRGSGARGRATRIESRGVV